MSVSLQLKQFTLHTTQVTLSTGVLASTLASGCSLIPHERDIHEGEEEDAVDGAVAETLRMTDAEASSHTYTQVPAAAGQPIVMPLTMEDSPTTPPPATALAHEEPEAQADAGPAPRIHTVRIVKTERHGAADKDERPTAVEAAMPTIMPEGSALASDAASTRKAETGAQAQDRASRDPDGCGAAYQAAVDAVTNASRHAHKRKARAHRDPVGESFIPPVTTPTTGSVPGFY